MFDSASDLEFLFCYLSHERPDIAVDWSAEASAVEELGFNCHSFDLERLLDGDAHGAIEDLPESRGKRLLYRGWILREEKHQELEDAVAGHGYELSTNTSQYLETSHVPNWHPLVNDLTPPAVWTWDEDVDEAWEAAQTLGNPPWIVKDHVKSFTGGIVVRPLVSLKFKTADFTGAPIFEEYRLVFWNGDLKLAEPYSPLDEMNNIVLRAEELRPFRDLGRRFSSPYFSADIGRKTNGDLVLIEINDGGTSGIPPLMDPREYYSCVWDEEDEPLGEMK